MGMVTYHVHWTPFEIKESLNTILHSRIDPLKFAKKFLDFQVCYNANWSDMIQIIKRVCGERDFEEIISKSGIPRNVPLDSGTTGMYLDTIIGESN